MKLIPKFTLLASLLVLYSCATTGTIEKEGEKKQAQTSESNKAQGKDESDEGNPAKPERKYVAPVPEFSFSGNSMRIEMEDMFTENISFNYEEEFSNGFAGIIKSSVSVAKAFVMLEKGSYEILAREKAEDSEHASFYIFVDNEPYRVSPSEPPMQSFENTTRFTTPPRPNRHDDRLSSNPQIRVNTTKIPLTQSNQRDFCYKERENLLLIHKLLESLACLEFWAF